MRYRFFYKELKWKFQQEDGTWSEQNPQKPFQILHAVDFIKIWKKCRYMNDIHKYLFWMTKEEIVDYFKDVNQALEQCDYEPLPQLEYASQGIFSDEDLIYLEDLGLICKKIDQTQEALQNSNEETSNEETSNEETSNEETSKKSPNSVTALYNRMKNQKQTYDPLRHVFTTEQGKFTVRH